jgi:hypothetical protein
MGHMWPDVVDGVRWVAGCRTRSAARDLCERGGIRCAMGAGVEPTSGRPGTSPAP